MSSGIRIEAEPLVAERLGGALAFPQVLTAMQVHFEEGPPRTRALGFYSAALASGANRLPQTESLWMLPNARARSGVPWRL